MQSIGAVLINEGIIIDFLWEDSWLTITNLYKQNNW